MSKVLIKSYAKGLHLILDPDCEFDVLIDEIAEKFHESRSFFGRMQVAISLDGRVCSTDEAHRIIHTIQSNCDLRIVCLVGTDQTLELFFENGLEEFRRSVSDLIMQQMRERAASEEKVKLVRGSVLEHDAITTPESLVICGDVQKGATVVSDGDVIVLGDLKGSVSAGHDGDTAHFVIALGLDPEAVSIAGRLWNRKSGLGLFKNSKKQPVICVVEDDELIVHTSVADILNERGSML
ncbi:MAG: hypothetical protein K6G23_04185 [Lachnospiraceae bacterium]|nr:hypothetical protein [Lachnospiraceae bacterium]